MFGAFIGSMMGFFALAICGSIVGGLIWFTVRDAYVDIMCRCSKKFRLKKENEDREEAERISSEAAEYEYYHGSGF